MKQKIIKMIALVMVLNILIIPLSSFLPGDANKYNRVEAVVAVEPLFFHALLAAITFTAVCKGIISSKFQIPDADMEMLRLNFQTGLLTNSTKSQNFAEIQMRYMAGGIAMILTQSELIKVCISDIYVQFLDYLKTNRQPDANGYVAECTNLGYTFIKNVGGYEICYLDTASNIVDVTEVNEYLKFHSDWTKGTATNTVNWYTLSKYSGYDATKNVITSYFDVYDPVTNRRLDQHFLMKNSYGKLYFTCQPSTAEDAKIWASILASMGIANAYTTLTSGITYPVGYVNNYDGGEIIDTTETTISVKPFIPAITAGVATGLLADTSIAIPAGTVPIDVPRAGVEDPITDPIDTPTDPSLSGTVAAILAAIFPISGLLNQVITGSDTIVDGITDVIDNIGAIPGEISDIFTGTLASIIAGITGITTSINDFVNPLPENASELDLNPIKNIPAVLFSRFPFSIPFDFYNIIAFMGGSAREAPEFEFKVPLDSIGQADIIKSIDMQPFNQIAGYIRIAELIAFAIAVMLKTKTLIWG